VKWKLGFLSPRHLWMRSDGWLAQISTGVRRYVSGQLIRNAASLYGTTIVTSIFGFFYWFIAARMVPASAVGIAAAIQASAQFLALVCVLGLSTFLISELAADRTHARTLILTAAVGAGAFAIVFSVVAAFALGAMSSTLAAGLTIPIGILVFALLAAFSTVLQITDDSCIGLMRGDLQLRRNTIFAISKLALLPLLIVLWPSVAGTELEVAWLAGLVISLVAVGWSLMRLTRGAPARLDFRRFIDRRRLMMGHHSLNLSIQSPRFLIPIVVTAMLGGQANAAFTAAILVVSFISIIPVHLSIVLFALTPGDEASLRREVHKTMRICLVLAIASAPFFILFSSTILGFFGPSYQDATAAFAILGLTTYPLAVKAHYVAISRSRGHMQQAANLSFIGGCLEVGLAAAGAAVYGLTGVALGYLLAVVIEAALFAPVVFGVLRAPILPELANEPGSGDGEESDPSAGGNADSEVADSPD